MINYESAAVPKFAEQGVITEDGWWGKHVACKLIRINLI
jgi:hypothetical protein